MHTTIHNLDQFNRYFNQSTLHPLVGIGDLSQASEELFSPIDFDSYSVILVDSAFGEIQRSGTSIRYSPGTMITLKPGEVISTELNHNVAPKGKILVFRREMFENTGLGRDFYMFNFFDMQVSSALTLNDAERGIILNCYANINAELHAENDELTGHMLRLGLGQMLSYCKRFYERQFDTKNLKISDFIRRLDGLIEGYYSEESQLPKSQGFPTVAWCSEQFHLAPNYFGNLVKRDLHISAQQYLHNKIVEKAKFWLSTEMSIDEVAEKLGFDYSNHFSRLFKKETGISPTQFRKNASQVKAND